MAEIYWSESGQAIGIKVSPHYYGGQWGEGVHQLKLLLLDNGLGPDGKQLKSIHPGLGAPREVEYSCFIEQEVLNQIAEIQDQIDREAEGSTVESWRE